MARRTPVAPLVEASARPTAGNRWTLLYAWLVFGIGAATALAALAAGAHELGASLAAFATLAPFVVAAELFPVRILRRGGRDEIVFSTVFTLCLLVLTGLGPAVLAVGLANLAADLRQHAAPRKLAFNFGQAVLCVAAAALVLQVLGFEYGTGQSVSLATGDVPLIVAAGVVGVVVNRLLIGFVLALAGGEPLLRVVGREQRLPMVTDLGLVSVAPVVLAVASANLLLVPLLLIPLGAVYKCAALLVRREHEVVHDPLTGLPNREALRRRVVESLSGGRPLALVLLDLDRFREVNDALGHVVGDELLRQVGPRLAAALGPEDLIARLGGDEFAALLTGADEDFEHGAMALLRTLEQPFALAGVSVQVEASAGVACAPAHGDDPDTLLRRADIALYEAKRAGSGVRTYRPEHDQHSSTRLSLLSDLRRGIEDGELVLHYQPKARFTDGKVCAVEALVRWEHPHLGLLRPDAFVPLAEQSGLSRVLTLTVLGQALRQAAAWSAQGLDLAMSVNLSMRNLHDPHFVPAVVTLLDEIGPTPRGAVLEVTESLFMGDPARAIAMVTSLRELGFEIALDDFGTGFSSLGYLTSLPVDELKIDRSFVAGVPDDAGMTRIVRAVVELAADLGLRSVAEGVERADTWQALAAMGCDQAQGYLLGRPVPAAELSAPLLVDVRSRRSMTTASSPRTSVASRS